MSNIAWGSGRSGKSTASLRSSISLKERAHQSGVLPGIHSIFGSEVRDATGHRDSSASENQDPGAGLDQAHLEREGLLVTPSYTPAYLRGSNFYRK